MSLKDRVRRFSNAWWVCLYQCTYSGWVCQQGRRVVCVASPGGIIMQRPKISPENLFYLLGDFLVYNLCSSGRANMECNCVSCVRIFNGVELPQCSTEPDRVTTLEKRESFRISTPTKIEILQLKTIWAASVGKESFRFRLSTTKM